MINPPALRNPRLTRILLGQILAMLLVACVGLRLTSGIAVADPGIPTERALDLMFPSSTPWADLPIVKWDHRARVLLAIDPGVSLPEQDSIRNVVKAFTANAPIADLQVEVLNDERSDVAQGLLANEAVFVIANHAIETSRERYRFLLRSVLPSDADVDKPAEETLARHEPGFTKYRFGLGDGRLNQAVTFINSNGNQARVASVLSVALMISFSPSITSAKDTSDILGKSATGTRITTAGYEYLRFLYSTDVPSGSRETTLRKSLDGKL